ncbi:MAG TPA: AAA family ATPase [Allosphingosinicella sp.]|jgi:ABC-type transport system involved in cytochrome c biogenesis ATPase subunit
MKFFGKFRDGNSPKPHSFPHVILAQDNWDDYGYKTTFDATLHLNGNECIALGTVKIMEEGREHGYTDLPREGFEKLDKRFCSFGGDLDYYEKLLKLGPAVYQVYLSGLRDAAYSDETFARFEDSEAFKVSLMRFSGAERTFADAQRLFRSTRRARRPEAGFLVKVSTRVARGANRFVARFDFRQRDGLPHRMNAVIGYNGTGKTRLLSNLAIIASGYGYGSKEEASAKTAGRFVDTPPPVKKVVVVSYSAFDTFVIPGKDDVEKARLESEGDLFGYVYFGLRERAEDAEDDFEDRTRYRLRTPQEIEAEFVTALARVREADRSETLLRVLRPLLLDASFQRIGLTRLYAQGDPDDSIDLFRSLSSGHKIVLKIVTELTAHLDGDEPTLVLIDEPETHLHPPLLAALLKSIRHCLEELDGYAIVATHSPVVLQELPSRFVRVLRRVGTENAVDELTLETFGESIGVITQEVFNLDDSATDWHGTLSELAEGNTLEEIEALFGGSLGFAARSHVVSVQDENDL